MTINTGCNVILILVPNLSTNKVGPHNELQNHFVDLESLEH